MRRLAVAAAVLAAAGGATASSQPQRARVRIVAFSDYHSHAVPFRSEGRPGQGGIARAVAFLREARRAGDTLVLSGGDMLNKGVPAWSDEYGCVEWPWLDGLVDAMALGNHDLDYGAEAFASCRASTRMPVLSANLLDAAGRPFLLAEGRPYLVRELAGVRIGAFAVAGPDVQRLIAPQRLPSGARWADAVASARSIVRTLREEEHVAAVVLFGHQAREDDEALVRAVTGIDLVLGTHSHHRSGLVTIAGTTTRYIAPYQYLAYVSDVRLEFEAGRLAAVDGRLVPLDATRPEDPAIASRVTALQGRLRHRRPERFEVVGRAAMELTDTGVADGESLIANWATETLRQRAGAHVFFSTASSFRAGLPRGRFTREEFLAALPYPNRIAVARLRGGQILEWLALSARRRGSDLFSPQSGLRYAVREGRVVDVEVLVDPARPGRGYAPLDPSVLYLVGTTDYQASFAEGYKQIFAAAAEPRVTDIDVHGALLDALRGGPARARLDGRIR